MKSVKFPENFKNFRKAQKTEKTQKISPKKSPQGLTRLEFFYREDKIDGNGSFADSGSLPKIRLFQPIHFMNSNPTHK